MNDLHKSDPTRYGIIELAIPYDNPVVYVNKRCEEIEEDILQVVFQHLLPFLPKYTWDKTMVIVKKEINLLLQETKRSCLAKHFASWDVITYLENKKNSS